MLAIPTICTLLLSQLALPDPEPLVSPSDFQGWINAAQEGTLAIPKKADQTARGFQYVFVGGFGNEWISGYFARNAKELQARGVSRSAIHFVYPSSHQTIEEHAAEVHERFHAIAHSRPERLVIIAHSQGACDAMAFALQEPEFVKDRVEALFLIQGPFGGSAVADYVRGEGPEMDARMPARFRVVAKVLTHGERFLLNHGKHGGLIGITRNEARQFWARQLEENAAAIPMISSKTYFLLSETDPSELSLFKKPSGWYLSLYDGPNDGLVAVSDQFLPNIGTVLGVVDCGHGDLTHHTPLSHTNKRLPQALIQSVVMAVANIEENEEREARESPPFRRVSGNVPQTETEKPASKDETRARRSLFSRRGRS